MAEAKKEKKEKTEEEKIENWEKVKRWTKYSLCGIGGFMAKVGYNYFTNPTTPVQVNPDGTL